MPRKISPQELEQWDFLIGKIKEADLQYEENRLWLEQRRAVRQAQLIVGEVPTKPDFIIWEGSQE